jgi:tRNA G10  N-methylase Trm11
MTETTLDPDVGTRAIALEATMWILEHSGNTEFDLSMVLGMAMSIEHYLTDGGSVAFSCSDGAGKFVRGQ